VLQGSNTEATRAALRSLIASILVFEDGGQLHGRLGLNSMPLFQPRNPQAFGGLVAGACFEAAECAVVGVPDERWGEVGHLAIVVSTPADPPQEQELLQYLGQRLARLRGCRSRFQRLDPEGRDSYPTDALTWM
jgi:acyl-CoA synthetase (AMP-forming)/AMP-acid ligase II